MSCVRQYGKDYIALEDAAHQAHKGIWQGTFEMPADWRKDQKIEKLLAQRGRSLPHGVLPVKKLHDVLCIAVLLPCKTRVTIVYACSHAARQSCLLCRCCKQCTFSIALVPLHRTVAAIRLVSF